MMFSFCETVGVVKCVLEIYSCTDKIKWKVFVVSMALVQNQILALLLWFMETLKIFVGKTQQQQFNRYILFLFLAVCLWNTEN